MKNFIVLSALFILTILSVISGQADHPAKFKRGLQNEIKIRKRHAYAKAMQFKKRLRRKRSVMDESDKESNEFEAELKFLEKWNPSMSMKESTAYLLFRGNVLDAIREQLDGDPRFLSSHVLELKNTSGGILGKIRFHFKKSEDSSISHLRFIVARGHLSSLKVDKKYFKVLKSEGTHQKQSLHKLTPHAQTQTLDRAEKTPQTAVQPEPQNQSSAQEQTQNPSQNLPYDQFRQQPQSPDETQSVSQTQSHTQDPSQVQTQIPSQDQSETQAQTQGQPQTQTEDKLQAQVQNQSQDQLSTLTDTQSQWQPGNQAQPQAPTQSQGNPLPASPQSQDQAQIQTQTDAQAQTPMEMHPQDQSLPEQQTERGPQSQAYSELSSETQPPALPQNQNSPVVTGQIKTQIHKSSKGQTSSSVKSPLSDTEDKSIFIKMNQQWYPFLSSHESAQYKMLAGNLEKGLKTVTASENSIMGIEVKDLLKAEPGLTKVHLSVKFLTKQGHPIDKLKAIVRTGNIAGIPVNGNFFEIKENDGAVTQK